MSERSEYEKCEIAQAALREAGYDAELRRGHGLIYTLDTPPDVLFRAWRIASGKLDADMDQFVRHLLSLRSAELNAEYLTGYGIEVPR